MLMKNLKNKSISILLRKEKLNNKENVSKTASDIVRAVDDNRWDGWLWIFWGWVGLLIIAGIWADNFYIEEVTTGAAKVVPSSREQVLQSLEGGILQEMLVHEGDTVKKGEIVARIDPTRAEASFKESANRLLTLEAQAARLKAESIGQEPVFPADVSQHPELINREMEAWHLRKNALDQAITGYKNSLSLINKELDMARKLSAQSLMSKTEVLKLERQKNDIEVQITDRKNRYFNEANDELSKVNVEMSSLQETALGRQDTLQRTELRSPVRGIINSIEINTQGGVVQPGAKIIEITPLGEQLLVETKIKPSDVAFLAPGQEAVVKISAYDYSVYGGLKGKVQRISPGAIKDDDAKIQRRPGVDDTYYRVMILTDHNTLSKQGSKKLEIIPGMTAIVDIRTGKKTMLQYLIRPLLRVQEAFREK